MSRKIKISSPYAKSFSIPEFSWKMKASPTKTFGTVRQNFFTEDRDTHSPAILSIKVFDARIFPKPGRIPLRNFLVQWDKKYSTGNSDITFLCKKFFEARRVLTHWKDTPRNFPAPWDKNVWRRKVIPPLLSMKIFHTRNILILDETPTNIFGTETKNLRGNNVISPSYA